MPRDFVLTAVWGKVLRSEEFRCFLRSWNDVRPTLFRPADLVVFYDGDLDPLTEEIAWTIRSLGIGDRRFIHRHKAFLKFLRSRDPSSRILTIDARDTVFQFDPFSLCPDSGVLLSSECITVSCCPWNSTQQLLLQKALPSEERTCLFEWMKWTVVNGSIVLGKCSEVAHFLMDRITADSVASEATDQATLTRLANRRQLPLDSRLCLHGYAMRGDPNDYPLFHQWDRTALKGEVLGLWGDDSVRSL